MPDHLFAFWNLENLFAPEDFPDRIEWIHKTFKKDLEGWSQSLFDRKLSQLSSVILQMKGGEGPDILGVCEVENLFVVEELAKKLNDALPDRNYAVVHRESEKDRRGIDTAILFDKKKFTAPKKTIFSHFVLRRTGTRDILQATFKSKLGQEIIYMANHWPSRSGGEAAASAGFRATAGETLGYWHERIREECGTDCPVIAMGDFNDEPFDPSLRFNANATREIGDVQRAKSAKFYNATWNYLSTPVISNSGKKRILNGTLYFKNDGNLFDQILLSPALVKGNQAFSAQIETAKIEAYSEMISDKSGEGPIRFGLPKGNVAKNIDEDGFSDHFPVSVLVREIAPS